MVDPRYYYGNLEELIQVEGIQEVLYLYNANTFFADTSLELALTPEESSSETTDRKSQVSEPSATTDGSDLNDSDTNSSDIDNSDTNTDSSDTDNSDADSSDADSSDAEAWLQFFIFLSFRPAVLKLFRNERIFIFIFPDSELLGN